ncbi:MAG TPA: universal stress protein, partial [Paraburkholderia sp.]|nr:universal stress protein [Paraburkholderia sp.]
MAEQVLMQNFGQPVVSPLSQGSYSDRFNDMEETIMYDHILVAVDGSESSKRALDEAIRMATLSHGKVTAIYVLEHSTTFAYAGEYDPLALTRAMRSDGERVLAEARER